MAKQAKQYSCLGCIGGLTVLAGLVFVGIIVVIIGLVASRARNPNDQHQTASTRISGGDRGEAAPFFTLFSEIKDFMADHPEFGHPTEVRTLRDWASGRRQGVYNDGNRYFLFYLKGDQIKTVYDMTGDRTLVWGEQGR